jgi:hypothetical protein
MKLSSLKSARQITPQDIVKATMMAGNTDTAAVGDLLSLLQDKSALIEGSYWTPLFEFPKTKNVGFVSLAPMIRDSKSEARKAATKYKYRLFAAFGCVYTQRVLRIKLPQDKGSYPLIPIVEGGTILPFAAVSGPIYDEEIKLKEQNNGT